ncbi:hypothetical protein D4R71_07900 [bacterium]|nr:MAG: hypothetical protein D4R71_07900 [bacterium]
MDSIKRTAYIINSNFSFYEKIFSNIGLNESFKFLASPTCINDIICSNHSDINIFNGRFHIAAYLQYTDFYPQNREDGKHNIPGFAKVRTKEEFEKYGTIEKAFECNRIPFKKIKKAYINNIGEINYSSKSHYHNCFQTPYLRLRKLRIAADIVKFRESDEFSLINVYGLTKDQSYSSIPLFVGKKLKLNVIYDKLKNKVVIGGKIVNIHHRLKVNLYPFGLLGISISYSITSNSFIDSKDLIAIQKIIARDNIIIYKKKHFNNYNLFLKYIKTQFETSVFSIVNTKESQDLGNVTTINFSNPNKNFPTNKEIVGILDVNSDYEFYSNSYMESYNSKFGKYENDFTIFKNNKLLYVFDEKWNYSRAKTLFNWAFSDVFFSIYVNRKLLKIFSLKTQALLSKTDSLSNEDVNFIESVNIFLSNFDQYKKLPRPLRMLFYRLNEELNFDYKKEVLQLQESLKTYQAKSQNDHFIDYFTINPNFMGLGVDFKKIIKKIKL